MFCRNCVMPNGSEEKKNEEWRRLRIALKRAQDSRLWDEAPAAFRCAGESFSVMCRSRAKS